MAGEFDLIARYFNWPAQGEGVSLSVGDDAALLSVKAQHQLAISVDTLVSGVHFPVNTHPADIGHKALSVNVSDMAAMGAEPRWFTLALTLPEYNTAWLEGFSAGLKQAADDYGVDLIGGDTTRGSQTITVQIMGEVTPAAALKRSAAKLGDVIFVTGTLGDAAAGLALAQGDSSIYASGEKRAYHDYCIQRLNRPTARTVESRIIRQYAHACIDVSDGLLQDLMHVLKASQCGAVINTDDIPFSEALSSLHPPEQCLQYALTGGDDYELLFTVPDDQCDGFIKAMSEQQLSCQAIGYITDDAEQIINQYSHLLTATGFQHF
ncbi:thiamine-phosphate kinase [Leucothrix pacifica]|uniref:Thiamine-monophosphate kinase n=1 Tax=Leucothrix pacifica TaxID=1247513 RepID=A0A317CQC1_9GAMM|nr:thiamine-phosphate kinase [Leucothrix pacifica]PWR00302.1 thiamine-phosphate kinase [Leucothrix pacifica]